LTIVVLRTVPRPYPDELRGTALGWALGIGRIGAVSAPQIGGWLLAAGLGAGSNFVLFAVSALAASLLLTVIWYRHAAPAETARALVLAH
jgi:AAHS family benzoate transporter-like MFS transporter